MQDAGLQARPGMLLKYFNARDRGRSASFQKASRLLRDRAVPTMHMQRVARQVWGG